MALAEGGDAVTGPLRIGALSGDRLALLDLLLAEEGLSTAQPQGIVRRVTGDVVPLSFAQQRLWFLDQLAPGNPFYNVPAAQRFRFGLNVEAFERALSEIVRRHESLRTRFALAKGDPVQLVAEAAPLELPVLDLGSLEAAQREREVVRLATDEARAPFDLARGPLVRARLLRLGPSDWVFLLTMHHIVCDGWSVGLLFQELAALYEAFALGRRSPLPELPVQYPDFALWQRGWLQGELLERQLGYWRERLQGLPVLELPTDRARPAVQHYRGAAHSFALPAPLVDGLRALGRREDATLFMVLLAGFKALLARYCSQQDIVVGAPIAGRSRAELEPLIGFFVNSLVLRTDLSGDPSFRELLGRVRETALGAYAHQDLPFEMLVEQLQPERDLSRNPLFQITFQLFTSPTLVQSATTGTLTALEVERGTSKFDITFDLWETEEGLGAQLIYDTDLFEAETMARLAGHYQTLLEGAAADPERPLSRLPLLTARERRQLLVEWTNTRRPYPREATVDALFSAQAQATPTAPAVRYGDQQLTYAELDRHANQLAHRLRELGVGPETPVAVCLHRSTQLIISLLATLKAGGAYLPLDPAYPKDRLAFMLADTHAPLLLTSERLLDNLPPQPPQLLLLEPEQPQLRHQPHTPPSPLTQPDNLAYLMYTSGSTGRPKGVMVPHHAITRLVKETDYATFGADETFLHFAPISFDASTFEIWGALLNGSPLVVLPEHVLSLAELAGEIERNGITTLWLTAGLFHQLVDAHPEALAGVRQLLAGGDVLSVPHARRALAALRGGRLINGYGPTEGTTFACCFPMTAETILGATVPIGRPIANARVYVLDDRREPVPVGVPGELYLGGDGLARGYWNRPELTAERFVPDPFDDDAEARLYRTGDLVRWLPDGNLEFLGRADEQVKLRGYRIELGEIEAVLAEHEAVRRAAVVLREDVPEDKRLVAYVVAEGQPAARDLRRFLAEQLPDYMLPSAFVFLDALPLSPNGKVERRSLPACDGNRPELDAAFVPPRTEAEHLLTSLWAEVLGLPRVGAHDNFFTELGGHSLLATQLVSRVRDAFGVDLPLVRFFEAPTIAELAAAIEGLLLDELEQLADAELPVGAVEESADG